MWVKHPVIGSGHIAPVGPSVEPGLAFPAEGLGLVKSRSFCWVVVQGRVRLSGPELRPSGTLPLAATIESNPHGPHDGRRMSLQGLFCPVVVPQHLVVGCTLQVNDSTKIKFLPLATMGLVLLGIAKCPLVQRLV